MKALISEFLLAFRRGHYATFSGTADRREFWAFMGFQMFLYALAVTVLSMLSIWFLLNHDAEAFLMTLDPEMLEEGAYPFIDIFAVSGGLMAAWALFSFLPALSVTVRRYHDVGLTGWWFALLIGIVASGIAWCIYDPLMVLSDPNLILVFLCVTNFGCLLHILTCMLPSKFEHNSFRD